MKIYFAYTIRGDRSRIETAKEIVNMLKEKGHDVMTEIFLSDNAEDNNGLSGKEIFNRNIGWLGACDVIVSEVSGSSFGIGYEIGYILGGTDKKAFILFESNASPKISLMATANTHKNAVICSYDNLGGIRKFIDEHF